MCFKEWLLLIETQAKDVNYIGLHTWMNDKNLYLKYSYDPRGFNPIISHDPILKIKSALNSTGRLEPPRIGGAYEIITGREYENNQVEPTETFRVYMPNEDARDGIALLAEKKHGKRRSA
jgi:hypothetical protein